MNMLKAPAVPFNLHLIHERQSSASEHTELPAGAVISIQRGTHALASLAEDWNRLASETGQDVSVFQSFSWTARWCAHFATVPVSGQILVVTGYHLGRLVFIWPLMKTQSRGVSTLEWLTFPAGQFGDVLLADGLCPYAWQSAALAVLKRCEPADLLHLRHVREGTSFDTFASKNMFSANSPERAPFMDLLAFKTEQDYEARYTSSQRKRRKKIRKDLEVFGPVAFRRLEAGPETDRAIAHAIAEKNRWLAERGRINRVLKSEAHLNFLQDLARRTDGIETVVTELTCGDKPVSWEIAFRHNGTHYGYITSHVYDMTDYSPGRLHMHMSQLMALKDGLQRFDLMVPYDVHKESWSNGMVQTQDYYLPLSNRGRAFGNIYLSFLRPMLRSAYYRLTPDTLKLLGPLTRRAC